MERKKSYKRDSREENEVKTLSAPNKTVVMKTEIELEYREQELIVTGLPPVKTAKIDIQHENYYNCIYCSANFLNAEKLEAHLDICSLKRCESIKKEIKVEGEDEEILPDKRYDDDDDDNDSTYEDSGTPDDDDDQDGSADSLKKKEKVNTTTQVKPFQCQICERSFMESKTLKNHVRVHSGERPYKCKFCSKSFTQSANCRRHQLIHKLADAPHKCSSCEKAYYTAFDLKRHVTGAHTSDKPYCCQEEFCTKKYTRANSLKKHMRMHTGDRPFKCAICSSSYARKSVLKCHLWTHKNQKPNCCHLCQKSFSTKGGLTVHLGSAHLKEETTCQE